MEIEEDTTSSEAALVSPSDLESHATAAAAAAGEHGVNRANNGNSSSSSSSSSETKLIVVAPDGKEMDPENPIHQTSVLALVSALLARCEPRVVENLWGDVMQLHARYPISDLLALWGTVVWQLAITVRLYTDEQRIHFEQALNVWLRCAAAIPTASPLCARLCINMLWCHLSSEQPERLQGDVFYTRYNMLYIQSSPALSQSVTLIAPATCWNLWRLVTSAEPQAFPGFPAELPREASELEHRESPAECEYRCKRQREHVAVKDGMMLALLHRITKTAAGVQRIPLADRCYLLTLAIRSRLDGTAAFLLPHTPQFTPTLEGEDENITQNVDDCGDERIGDIVWDMPRTYLEAKRYWTQDNLTLATCTSSLQESADEDEEETDRRFELEDLLRWLLELTPAYTLETHAPTRAVEVKKRHAILLSLLKHPPFVPVVLEALAVMHMLEPEVQSRMQSLATLVLKNTPLSAKLVSYVVQYETSMMTGVRKDADDEEVDERLHASVMQHLEIHRYKTAEGRQAARERAEAIASCYSSSSSSS